MDTQAGTRGVSRRRLVKGAAWAVPAVAVVAASPAYAASSKPTPPEGVGFSKTTSCGTTVTWSAVSGATGYDLQYSVDGTNWLPSAPVTTTSTTYTFDTPTYPNNISNVRVRSKNIHGVSGWTSIPTVLAAPTAPVVTRTPGTRTITWPAVAGAVQYEIEYTASNGNWNDSVLKQQSGVSFDVPLTYKRVRVRSLGCPPPTTIVWSNIVAGF